MPFLQSVNVGTDTGPAGFDASMTLFDNIRGHVNGMGKIRILHIQADILVQCSLVALEGKNVMTVPFDNGFSGTALGMHGINGYVPAVDVQKGRDLV